MGQLENLNLRYPKELVEEYGAKAGVLMYVAEQRPDIPQMPMVTSKIGEPARDFLRRVDQAGIKWPRLFRSSAVVELVGFEGNFPTHKVDTFKGEDNISRYFNLDGGYDLLENDEEFNKKLEDLVRKIAYSPRGMAEVDQLPSEINVITAEFVPCQYIGTFIKHPNRNDYYIATLVKGREPTNKLTWSYHPRSKFHHIGYNSGYYYKELTPDLEKDLEEVIGWHDAIAGLPQMDADWAYQIEFGLMPTKLFQVRPFKPIEKANFAFEELRLSPDSPIVIGVTDKDGEDYEVASFHYSPSQVNLPALYFRDLHWFRKSSIDIFRNITGKEPQGYAFCDGNGVLTHQDVWALRRSKLALIYPRDFPRELKEGIIVNIVSDGIQVRMTDKLTGEEIF